MTGNDGKLAFNWKYFGSMPAIFNLLIISLVFVSIRINNKLEGKDLKLETLISQNEYFVNF